MGMDVVFHYVCTRREARKMVKRRDWFWVSNCGCREAFVEDCIEMAPR